MKMVIKEWKTYERQYCIDLDRGTFEKSEIPVNTNAYGKQTTPWKSKARIRNEYLALKLVKEFTNIPAPEAFRLREIDGCLSVTMEYVPGIALDDLPQSIRSIAVAKADKFINELVLPQLAALKSHTNGALTGDIIPPRRVAERYPKASWRPITKLAHDFTYCHNDLGQHNILCDPKTGDVVSIIDWEYAGYYDDSFEGSLWQSPHNEIVYDEDEVANLAARLNDLNQGETIFSG